MADIKSFSFIQTAQEMVTRWPTPFPTPVPPPTQAAAYRIEVEGVDLDPKVLMDWFSQSIIPLVGSKAADVLTRLFQSQPKIARAFALEAIKHLEKTQPKSARKPVQKARKQ